ncbi:MAG: hypothetical protein AVDCRST_MAG57-2763 [uncultured Blastococcus sp.]|uniref:Uncharacterized protein n=1 Tax=uncultured Blastococcus sp. TaxID=217144 RepID=A0A6J4IZN6_9ACTN|nr:MAG: hypothetical protein AVDCRST_MAG57-2763 [uncultured Blastococcus sp.]
MTERPHDDVRREPAHRIDDPTRDIRLPPVPGRPAAPVPPKWAGLMHTPESAPGDDPTDHHATVEPSGPAATTSAAPRIADQPTDELGNPVPVVRERTLAFAQPSPPDANASADTGAPAQGPSGYLPPGHPPPHAGPRQAAPAATPRRRRSTWPWVLALLVLLTLFAVAVVLAWVGSERDNLQSFWEAGAPIGYGPG